MKYFQISVVVALLALAGCTNSTKPSELPQFRVTDVRVSLAPGIKTNSDVAQTISASSRRLAAAYSSQMPANVPGKTVTVRVDRWHYKNPLASLLIGDGNSANGYASVSNGPSGPIRYADTGSFAVNGIVGAAIAAGSDKAKVDARLATGVAEQALSLAYGQKRGTPRFVKDYLAGKRPARAAAPQPRALEQAEPQKRGPIRQNPDAPGLDALSPTS